MLAQTSRTKAMVRLGLPVTKIGTVALFYLTQKTRQLVLGKFTRLTRDQSRSARWTLVAEQRFL